MPVAQAGWQNSAHAAVVIVAGVSRCALVDSFCSRSGGALFSPHIQNVALRLSFLSPLFVRRLPPSIGLLAPFLLRDLCCCCCLKHRVEASPECGVEAAPTLVESSSNSFGTTPNLADITSEPASPHSWAATVRLPWLVSGNGHPVRLRSPRWSHAPPFFDHEVHCSRALTVRSEPDQVSFLIRLSWPCVELAA